MQAPADWWYIDPDSGAVTGPVTGAVMIDLAHQGIIRADTMVSRDAGMTWRAAGTVRGFPVAGVTPVVPEDDPIPDLAGRDRLAIRTGSRYVPGSPWHNLLLAALAYLCVGFGVAQFICALLLLPAATAAGRATVDERTKEFHEVEKALRAAAAPDPARGERLADVYQRREALRVRAEMATDALAAARENAGVMLGVAVGIAVWSFGVLLVFAVAGAVVLAALDAARDLRIVRARLE